MSASLLVGPAMAAGAGAEADGAVRSDEARAEGATDGASPVARFMVLNQQAEAAFMKRRYGEAARLMGEATALMPDNETAHYGHAAALAMARRQEEAIQALRRAVETGWIDVTFTEKGPALRSLRKRKAYRDLLARMRVAKAKADQALAAIPPARPLYVAPPPRADADAQAGAPVNAQAGAPARGREPLLVALHGTGGAPERFRQTMEPVTRELGWGLYLAGGGTVLGQTEQGGGRYNWAYQTDPARIAAEVRALIAVHPRLDPDRVYLLGFSSGAVIALPAAIHAPDLYAGVIPIGGTWQPELVPKRLLGQSPTPARPSVWVLHGGTDRVMPYLFATEAATALPKHGMATHLDRYAGGHTLPRDLADRLRRAAAWFEENRRAAPDLYEGFRTRGTGER